MKKLFILAAATLLSGSAFSQTMSGSDARFGLKAGVNLSKYSGKGSADLDWKNNTGFHVTAFGDFGIGNNFFIQPAVSLQNKGAKLESNSSQSTGSYKQNIMAIEVPINAVFRIPTGNSGEFQINAGPYIDFNISGKNKISGTYSNSVFGVNVTDDSDVKFGNDSDDDLKNIDFGINTGLAYRMSSGILVGANYGWGLTNLIPNDLKQDDDKITNRVLSFSIGYSF